MKFQVFNYLLLKLASRCNLKCTYCYWFRDKSVYDKPKILTPETEKAFLYKLELHIKEHQLDHFSILFHGGEPLLFGKDRFLKLVNSLKKIEKRTNCFIDLSMTTNAVLIDKEWAQIIKYFNVSVTVSIDGPSEIHDKSRVDHMGHGSYDRVIRGLNLLREQEIEPGVLAVCNPSEDPNEVTNHFIETLGLKRFDILIPDATHNDFTESVAQYYIKLFDLWYDDYHKRGITIRYIRSLLKGLLGGDAKIESIGYGPIQTLTMLPDGSLEPLDVLRIAGNGHTKTNISIHTDTFQDVTKDPVWLEAYQASLNLPEACQKCEYITACGGGFLPNRWSNEKRYDNPNVYCSDIKEVLSHIWNRVLPEISVISGDKEVPLIEVVNKIS